MLVAMTAMLVSVAEFSNILSVLAVLICFCAMFLLIMRWVCDPRKYRYKPIGCVVRAIYSFNRNITCICHSTCFHCFLRVPNNLYIRLRSIVLLSIITMSLVLRFRKEIDDFNNGQFTVTTFVKRKRAQGDFKIVSIINIIILVKSVRRYACYYGLLNVRFSHGVCIYILLYYIYVMKI